MQVSLFRFSDLNADLLYRIIKLRIDVFVVEQACAYPELDTWDTHAETRHVCVFENETLVAYCRILDAGTRFPTISLGRIVVHSAHRGKKQADGHRIGETLIKHALSIARKQSPKTPVTISAQTALLDYYQALGFIPQGEAYLEDAIPHIEMQYHHELV